jgi:cation diffusion facilitator family transporter
MTEQVSQSVLTSISPALRVSLLAMTINGLLAGAKIVTGFVGHSYALIADGMESMADIFSSFIVWSGLRISAKPADECHPFGHGKAEAIASVTVSVLLLGTAMVLAVQSVREILLPHHAPAPFTLLVLILVIVIKELLYRWTSRVGRRFGSTALQGDAWHHRSDALTSLAAFVGITIALLGGEGYESADDYAALAACSVIAWNGLRLLRTATNEVMDASVSADVVSSIRKLAGDVAGVRHIEKCRIRKVGLNLSMDIHVVVDGELSVRKGHDIAHQVKDTLLGSAHRINDVTVHIEPDQP